MRISCTYIYAFQAQLLSYTGEVEEWLPARHLDNRFLLKSRVPGPEVLNIRWPQEEVYALPSN